MRVKNSIRVFIIPLSIFCLFLFVSPVLGIDWVKLATTGDGHELSYDKGSVREIDAGTYRLWERIIYSDEGMKDNVKTTVFIREINCQKNQHRIISIIDYDARGDTLFSGSDGRANWSPIPAGTVLDDLKKIVCPK